MVTGTMSPNFDTKHALNVLSSQTRSQNSAYTIRKSLIFCVLCTLFEQISSGINRDILKSPTLCGAKNRNKLHVPSHFGHVDSPKWLSIFMSVNFLIPQNLYSI